MVRPCIKNVLSLGHASRCVTEDTNWLTRKVRGERGTFSLDLLCGWLAPAPGKLKGVMSHCCNFFLPFKQAAFLNFRWTHNLKFQGNKALFWTIPLTPLSLPAQPPSNCLIFCLLKNLETFDRVICEVQLKSSDVNTDKNSWVKGGGAPF